MGFNNRQLNKRPRRPSHRDCYGCGERVDLVSCGVDEHQFAPKGTRRQLGDCNGRVYVHLEGQGDCLLEMQQ